MDTREEMSCFFFSHSFLEEIIAREEQTEDERQAEG